MTSTDRRSREQAAVREKILAAARDLFVREPYERVSLRRIAEAIEYSPAAIYTHFRDKDDLLRTLCHQDFGALSEVILALQADPDPVGRIAQYGLAYVRFAVEHPHHYRFMFMTPLPGEVEPDPQDVADKDNPERNGYAALQHAVKEAMAQGRFRAEFTDAELLAQTFWAAVHGVASLEITMGTDPWIDWRPLEARTRASVRATLRGMLRDPERLP